MGFRLNPIDEARRSVQRQLAELVGDLRAQRLVAGHSQRTVADAIGCSRQLLADWERGDIRPTVQQLACWGAAVGLEVRLRGFLVGSPLRDKGQLRLLDRAHRQLAGWTWRTEVPVSRDPADRRAIDAVLSGPAGRIGLEAITRLTDAQGQVRAALLKQEAAALDRIALLLSDTRHNRAAVRFAAPTLRPAFPLTSRQLFSALRGGQLPSANGILLL